MRYVGWIAPILFVAIFTAVVLAVVFIDEYEYSAFDHYKTDVDIIVNDDGSLSVTETYQFSWSDDYSGEFYITFPEDKVNSTVRDSVKCFIDGKEAARVAYEFGDHMTYTGPEDMAYYSYGWNRISGDWEINAFYKRAWSGSHTVSFQYELNDVVIMYTDCVDLYYKVFTSFSENLKDLTVTVTMPAGSLQSKTYIFGHGDPNGYCEFIDDTADAAFKSPKLKAWTMFEIRVVNEQTSLYSITPERTDKTLDSILAEEKSFRDETAKRIFLKNVMIWLIVLMIVASIVVAALRFKMVKRNKPTFDQTYMRELPSFRPNIVASLADHYKMKKGHFGNKITATILNLALQKVIAIEKGKDNDIVFIPLNPNAALSSFERSVYKMLFSSTAGSNEGVTLSQLKKEQKKDPTDNFNLFENDKKEYKACGFDEAKRNQNRLWKYVPLIPVVLALAAFIICLIIDFLDYIPLIIFPGFFVFIMLMATSEKTPIQLTVNGENERAKVLALKKFYTDMTLMKERQAMELPLWEKHLVYATALGVADKVLKELDVRLTEMRAPSSGYSPFIYIYTLHSVGGLSKTVSSINQASYSAFVRSSGISGGGGGYSSGGGGGFSGGGGGGFGGGGGGHR